MIAHVLIAGCTLLGQAAAPSADDDLARTVRKLVHQLDALGLKERDAAEADLVRLGPAVLDHLPETTPRDSSELVHRLGTVRHKLELALAERAAKPSLVTLKGSQMPLAEVLSAIQKQTGNKIDLAEQAPEEVRQIKLDVAFDKTPFWQAVDQVLDRAGLTAYAYGEGAAVHVVPRPEAHVPRARGAVYSGPFRLVPLRVVARRELRETIGDNLQITLEATWEPRLAPIILKQPMDAVQAVDEKGNPLKIGSREAEFEITIDPGTTATELVIPLELPPREVTRIASLKGTLSALLPGRVQTFRFKDLAKAKDAEQRKAGAIVTLQQVRKTGEVWEVRILVRFDEAGEALDSHRGWILNNEAHMEGPDGKPVENGGLETTRRTKTEVGIAYFFDLEHPLSEYTFVYKTPSLLIAKQFPYEIKDVKLP